MHDSSPVATEDTSSDTLVGYLSESDADQCINSSIDNKCVDSNKESLPRAYETEVVSVFDEISEIDRLNYKKKDSSHNIKPAEGSNTTLRQVIFLHRHGDRTPMNFPPKDKLRNEPFWAFHGYGQLTNRGKARLHLLGRMTRERYDEFLSRSVNKNQRISRASGALRCIESAQVFLSGFLALDETGSPDSESLKWDSKEDPLAQLWQPASVQSVPVSIDGMLAESADCKSLMDEYKLIDRSDLVRLINNEYKSEAQILNSVLGFNMDHFYKWFWASSQIEVERSYFESKMDPKIIASYDRIQQAGNLALEAYQSSSKSRRLRSGLLISDMISHMKNCRDAYNQTDLQQKSKKFVHYAAHDMTLIVILGMFGSWQKFPFRPDYASNIALELHHDDDDWFIKIFYMPHVPAEPTEIHLEHCEKGHPRGICTLDKFIKLMKPYTFENWQEWMRECGNQLDKIDPYSFST